MSAEAVLHFRIPAEPHLARVVRQVVGEFAGTNGIERDDLGHFLTALGEAVANAIEHAQADDGIAIEVRIDHKCIVATVLDAGIGFAAAPGDTKLPELDAERGRGLAIMRRCSDIFTVTSEPGKGTAVVIGRYLRKRVRRNELTVPEVRLA